MALSSHDETEQLNCETILFGTILDVRKIGHLNIETKMLDIEARVLIGWYSLASQSERVPTRCFYVKVAYLSYGEYIIAMKKC